jgi:hypothetical protein
LAPGTLIPRQETELLGAKSVTHHTFQSPDSQEIVLTYSNMSLEKPLMEELTVCQFSSVSSEKQYHS